MREASDHTPFVEQPDKPYNQFENGQRLSFPLYTVASDGTLTTTLENATIEAVKGGGFYGKVLLLEDKAYVIKTSLPGAGKHFLRTMNWDREFPGENDEREVQAEHVANRLIHTVLPYATDNTCYAPQSYGYTRVAGRLAHVIERVSGRGPRFDLPFDDYQRFKDAQQKLFEVGTRLGLEQGGQIHPENPYGLPNVWWNEERNQWIWVDTVAAFRHTGRVWPNLIPYDFHRKIRESFGEEKPTFNRIHTDRFRQEIRRLRIAEKLPQDVYEKLLDDLWVYDGLIQKAKAQEIEPQKVTALLPPAKKVTKDIVTKVPITVAETVGHKVADPFINIGRLALDRQYRRTRYTRTIDNNLEGVREAHERNILSDDEYETIVKNAYANGPQGLREESAMKAVGVYYGCVWVGTKLAEGTLIYDSRDDNPLKSVGILAAGTVTAPVLRFIGTKAIGKATGRNLDPAANTSLIPTFGNAFPFLAQKAADYGELSKAAWHYAVVSKLAALSRLHPAGGWGTDLHAKLVRFGGKVHLVEKPDPGPDEITWRIGDGKRYRV